MSLPASPCSWIPLDATQAAYLRDWHDYRKHNFLQTGKFRKGGCLSTSDNQGHWAEKGEQSYAKGYLGAWNFKLILSLDFFDLLVPQKADSLQSACTH